MQKFFICLLFAFAVLAQSPPTPPAPADACLALEKDPTQGEVVCLYCYGYKTIPFHAKCDTKNFDNCIFSLQIPGFPKPACNLCQKGYAVNLNDGTCVPVSQSDVVPNCDYYWIPEKMTNSKCSGCSTGYVANFTKQETYDISCTKDDSKLIANCQSQIINQFKKSSKETVTVMNCQICEDGFTLYQTIKATGFLKDIVTSQCIPQTNHFQGCAVHNRQYNILGELEASYCGMCDPRGSYKAHEEIDTWKKGDKMCKKISSQETEAY